MTVAVHEAHQVIAVWPGLHEQAYGVAIDVGSTTIAGHLANLADGAVLASNGVMNPQIRFGEDLMSRVSYAMMHPEGAGEMTAAVRKALDGLIASLAMRAGIKRAEILELAIVGNPIMHHLLLGHRPDARSAGAPFALATDRAVRTTAAELGLRAHPGARVYVLPCIAGHVGADTAGVILAEEPHRAERMTLVVDVGHERRDRRWATGTGCSPRRARPARPSRAPRSRLASAPRRAPSSGSGSTATTLEPRFRVIGVDAWSDEPAFGGAGVAGAEGPGITGICGSGIIEVVAELFLAGIVTADGVIDGSLAARTARVMPDGRTFSYVLHDPTDGGGTRTADRRSPRTTSGRSSSPRPRCTRASGC